MHNNRITLSAKSLIGDKVVNTGGEDLGKLEEIMIDVRTGQVAYAVLSFGGFLGLGDKLFALPWTRLRVDEADKKIVVDMSKSLLENAPGFDKNNWPDLSDAGQRETIDSYYA
jgi:sporulation protein YlmC with PRC-barrel domain